MLWLLTCSFILSPSSRRKYQPFWGSLGKGPPQAPDRLSAGAARSHWLAGEGRAGRHFPLWLQDCILHFSFREPLPLLKMYIFKIIVYYCIDIKIDTIQAEFISTCSSLFIFPRVLIEVNYEEPSGH